MLIRRIFYLERFKIISTATVRAVRKIKQVIYVDVLVCLNTIISFFMLGATRLICRERTKRRRMLVGSFLGGAYSLCIFLPEVGAAVDILSRVLFLLVLTLAVFGYSGRKRFVRAFLTLSAVSFLFAGAVLGIWLVFKPHGLIIRNSGLYLDIGFLPLVLFSAAVYIAVTVFMRFFARNASESCECSVSIAFGGRSVTLGGIIDTGNTLTDSFTGKGVSVLDRAAAFLILDEKAQDKISSEALPEGMHLTVSNTVSGEGLLPVFTADKMTVKTDSGFVELQNPTLAVSKTESFGKSVSVLINADIFQLLNEGTGGELNAEKAVAENKSNLSRKKEKRGLLHKRSADSACAAVTGSGKRSNAKN